MWRNPKKHHLPLQNCYPLIDEPKACTLRAADMWLTKQLSILVLRALPRAASRLPASPRSVLCVWLLKQTENTPTSPFNYPVANGPGTCWEITCNLLSNTHRCTVVLVRYDLFLGFVSESLGAYSGVIELFGVAPKYPNFSWIRNSDSYVGKCSFREGFTATPGWSGYTARECRLLAFPGVTREAADLIKAGRGCLLRALLKLIFRVDPVQKYVNRSVTYVVVLLTINYKYIQYI